MINMKNFIIIIIIFVFGLLLISGLATASHTDDGWTAEDSEGNNVDDRMDEIMDEIADIQDDGTYTTEDENGNEVEVTVESGQEYTDAINDLLDETSGWDFSRDDPIPPDGNGNGNGDDDDDDDEPSCVSNQGSSCNCNACGQCGGTVRCGGGCSGGTPGLPSGYGNSCNCGACGCGGTITCSGSCSGSDPTPSNYGSLCNRNVCGAYGGTIQCGGTCSGATPTTPTQITRECKQYTEIEFNTIHDKEETSSTLRYMQIQGNSYYACPIDNADTVCCTDPNSCVYNGQCYPDRYKGDIDGDGIREICIASSPGEWIDEFETNCNDNIDNDLDGLTDCQDTDCAGSISGNVQNTDSENIDNARIDTLKESIIKHTAFTQPSGNYQINNVLCGTYDMIASEPGYVSSTKSNINLAPKESKTVDFTGSDALVSGSTCETDCTYVGDNIIHKECDGINDCAFFDATTKEVCNLAQPGWIRDYSETQEIECAEGTPQDKTEVKATVTCEEENLIKLTKVVTYKGKLVKLVVVTCG